MTAETTRRAEPWPREMNQNWRVRNASPTVKPVSSCAISATAPGAEGLVRGGAGAPSTTSP